MKIFTVVIFIISISCTKHNKQEDVEYARELSVAVTDGVINKTLLTSYLNDIDSCEKISECSFIEKLKEICTDSINKNEFATIDAFEQNLHSDTYRQMLYGCMIKHEKTALPLLIHWSNKYKSVVELMRYNQNGAELLMLVIEDGSRSGNDKALAAGTLASMGRKDYLERLMKYKDDKTPVLTPSKSLYDIANNNYDVLGDIIKESIKTLDK